MRIARNMGRVVVLLLAAGGVLAEDSGNVAPPAPAEEPTQGRPAVDSLEFPPEIEALLNETSDPDAYTEMERCLSTRQIRRTEILDERHVVFEMPHNRLYLVQFRHRCPGLRPSATLVYEPRHDRLCRLDQVRAYDGLVRGHLNAPCSIPGFHPVQAEQVALLRESLKNRGRRANPPVPQTDESAATDPNESS